jgi:predicted lysophospholipase L1 biosynthesis ABC-type transport system permease subunit
MKNDLVNPQEDIQAIREIMERSSRFLSLSGLSGIFAGIMAILGAVVAWFFILDSGQVKYDEYMRNLGGSSTASIRFYLALDALLVLGLAISGAVYFSYRKARKAGQRIWTAVSKRLIVHLMIPLISGGIFTLILLYHNNLELLAAVMLIFYGLSLVNAGKFTFGEIHYLGLTQIVLGILAGIFTDYGLLLWVIGFGLMHIVYGSVMFFRYESGK